MKILVVGGGAREHVMCEAICKSKNTELFSVMKNLNPGIQKLSKDVLQEKETNIENVLEYASKNYIELALIGPEAPLEVGIVDALEKQGISTCAPMQKAARIETDKEWMRNILNKYNIPGQLKYRVEAYLPSRSGLPDV